VGVGCGGCWELLVGGEKGQGSDVVMEFVSGAPYAKTTSKKPHQATKSKAQADFCGSRSTRAAIESVSCHSGIQRNPECRRLAPHNSNPAPFFARNDLR
jgi:hypothetical protein